MTPSDKKILVLIGPTGVGKTGASILLAKMLNTEIISADSMQIYRHMDIGTAKPTEQERSVVRHHMIDIVDPWESFSTGRYIERVVPIIESLHEEGKIPLIVGGTGLYIKAMTRGFFSGPSADWGLRERLLSMEEEEKGYLHACLKDIDPEAAGKITPNDTRRIVRALEVCFKSEGSMSEVQKRHTKPLPYRFIKIGLTRERKELYRLIEERVDEMFRNGLIEEVEKILAMIEKVRPGFPLPSMQAIGYKEIVGYLRREISLEEAVHLIKRGTKRYAKRQFTWFGKEEGIRWFDITGIRESSEVASRVSAGSDGLFPQLKGEVETLAIFERNTIC
ncbi:MAG: tRNA (adenosine(37)-N6)-dimethylallyltransferase MiaA [Nitrospirota bacterium]